VGIALGQGKQIFCVSEDWFLFSHHHPCQQRLPRCPCGSKRSTALVKSLATLLGWRSTRPRGGVAAIPVANCPVGEWMFCLIQKKTDRRLHSRPPALPMRITRQH
jgi:hypothetical protein